MKISNHDLAQLAHNHHITTTHHTTGPKGYWSPSRRLISTRRGLTIAQYRSTFAHELGHALHHDTPTRTGIYSTRQERRADRYAAHLLIHEPDLWDAAAFYGHNLPAIAHDLEVTLHLLVTHLTLKKRTTP